MDLKNKVRGILNVRRNNNKVISMYGYSNSSTENKDCNLKYLIRNVIIVGQCFALWPVDGLTEDRVIFRWLSISTFYSLFIIIVQFFYTMIVVIWSEINFQNFFGFVVIVWNVRSLLILLLFLKMGIKWPSLIKQWTDVESSMVTYGPIPNVKMRFRILCCVFSLLGVFEHLIFVGGATKRVLSKMDETDNFLERYFDLIYQEFFSTVGYSFWKAAIVELISLIVTFAWQFCDLIIILLTSTLAERFKQIANKIKSKTRDHCILEWDELQSHYNKLSLLCKTLNSTIWEMVLLSLCGNIYFMSVSIFQVFTPKTPYERLYFWYGILLNVTHFTLVCLYAAWVEEESTSSISDILSESLGNFPREAERFLFQIAENKPAIYGGGMFKITRGTILRVTNLILSLQLVYVQFHTYIPSNIE